MRAGPATLALALVVGLLGFACTGKSPEPDPAPGPAPRPQPEAALGCPIRPPPARVSGAVAAISIVSVEPAPEHEAGELGMLVRAEQTRPTMTETYRLLISCAIAGESVVTGAVLRRSDEPARDDAGPREYLLTPFLGNLGMPLESGFERLWPGLPVGPCTLREVGTDYDSAEPGWLQGAWCRDGDRIVAGPCPRPAAEPAPPRWRLTASQGPGVLGYAVVVDLALDPGPRHRSERHELVYACEVAGERVEGSAGVLTHAPVDLLDAGELSLGNARFNLESAPSSCRFSVRRSCCGEAVAELEPRCWTPAAGPGSVACADP